MHHAVESWTEALLGMVPFPVPVVAPSSPVRAATAGPVPPPTPERNAAFHEHAGARRADARMKNDDDAAHDASPLVRGWF